MNSLNQGVRLCFIHKNEGLYALLKSKFADLNNRSQAQDIPNILESFSSINILPSQPSQELEHVMSIQPRI
jgi:hypothetical protein